MATLNELQDMWAEDCKIDELDLGAESIGTPNLHAKYVTHLANFKLQLRKAQADLARLERVKSEYFLSLIHI